MRFGLRRADDAVVTASVKIADALLKVDTPAGPAWHRYNDDGYGEHDDGRPYDGTGAGAPGRCSPASAVTTSCCAAATRCPT